MIHIEPKYTWKIFIIITALTVLLLAIEDAESTPRRRITGLSISVVGGTDLTAELEIQMNTIADDVTTFTNTIYGRYIYGIPGYLGKIYDVYCYTGYPARVRGILNSPVINAIEFGSTAGTPVLNTTIPLVSPGSPGTYRGSFLHTYPSPGIYTAKVGACFNIIALKQSFSTQPIVTGNPVQLSTGAPFVWTSIYYYYTGTMSTSTEYWYHTTVAPSPITVGVTNTTTVEVPISRIPASSYPGMIILALSLTLAGFWLLRKC